MKKNIIQALLVSTFVAAISGCAFAPYELTPNAPRAFVKNTIKAPYSYKGDSATIKISLYDNKQPYTLLMISTFSNKDTPAIAIEANKSLRFGYVESSVKGSYCSIMVEAALEPNKQYAFVGGSSSQLNQMILMRSSGCKFGIVDLKTGNIVSRKVGFLQ